MSGSSIRRSPGARRRSRPGRSPACCAPDDAPGSRSRAADAAERRPISSVPAYFSAGINPNNRPDSSESSDVNASATDGSIEISLSRGESPDPWPPARARPAYARPTPSSATHQTEQHAFEPAARERSVPSPAPSAARTVSSRCRTSARTSSRLATLAHAMSITRPMVAMTTHRTSVDVADHLLFERAKGGSDSPGLVHLVNWCRVHSTRSSSRWGPCAPCRHWLARSSSRA